MRLTHPLLVSAEVSATSVYSPLLAQPWPRRRQPEEAARLLGLHLASNPVATGLGLYGDDLDNDSVHQLVDAASARGVRVAVDVSASSESAWHFVARRLGDIDTVRLVLYSLEPGRHNARLGSSNLARDVLGCVRGGQEVPGGRVVVVPVDRANLDELEDVARFADEWGWHVNPLPVPHGCRGPLLDHAGFDRFLATMRRLESGLSQPPYVDAPLAYESVGAGVCPALRFSIDVSHAGAVRACRFSSRVLGDVAAFDAVWEEHATAWGGGPCGECEALSRCGGGCWVNRESPATPDRYCSRARTQAVPSA